MAPSCFEGSNGSCFGFGAAGTPADLASASAALLEAVPFPRDRNNTNHLVCNYSHSVLLSYLYIFTTLVLYFIRGLDDRLTDINKANPPAALWYVLHRRTV